MKDRIGDGFIIVAVITDIFLYLTTRYWNASAISDEEFWATLAVLLCVRLTLAWFFVFVLSLMDAQLGKLGKWVLGLYGTALIVHTIWFAIQVL